LHAAQVVLPPLDSCGVEEIWERCVIRPYLPNECLSIKLQEYSCLLPINVCSVIILRKRTCRSTSIENRNIFHTLIVEIFDEIGKSLECNLGIINEVSIVLHVVYVGPHHIKRDAVVAISREDLFQDIS